MAEGPSRKQSATISFTLPISCQICLGKVKEPIVCPNQHVFCTACMNLWLQHNEHCPTCRTPITPDNPCKPVIGAGTQSDGNAGSLSTAAMRKARFDVLYQDYENEIQRLEAQIELLHSQNKALSKQLDTQAGRDCDKSSKKENSPHSKSSKKDCEFNALMSLTKKLQEATRTFEGIKSNLEQKNARLEQDNENLKLENQKLRQGLAERSPQKYGRFTVAAQQSKLEQYEREIKQLKRALKTNDDYVDQLEGELVRYKKFEVCSQDKSSNLPGVRSLQSDESAARLSSGRERNSSASSGVSSLSGENSRHDLLELDISQSEDQKLKDNPQNPDEILNTNQPKAQDLPRYSFTTDNSLNLELPTPITPASFLSRMSLDPSSSKTASTPQDQHFLSSDESGSANSRGSSRRRLNFGQDSKPKESEGNRSRGQRYKYPPGLNQKPYRSSDDSFHLEQPNDAIANSDLDITVTSDFEDCTRLMSEASQRVEQRRLGSSESDQSTMKTSDSTDQASSFGLYPTLKTDTTLAGSSALSMSQLQATSTWPNRPGSAPGIVLDNIHTNHSSSNSYPEMRRPNSAPGVTEGLQNQLAYQSNLCNSVSLDSANCSIWRPLFSYYPGTSKTTQPSNSTSTLTVCDNQTEVVSCPTVNRQPWHPPLKNRVYSSGQPTTTTPPPGLEFSQFSTTSQPSLVGTLNQARPAGVSSASYMRPIGRVSQYPPPTSSIVPQPLRAMHQLQEMHMMRAAQIPNAAGMDSGFDSRKRKPESGILYCSTTSSSQQEPPGSCSPSKTFKLF